MIKDGTLEIVVKTEIWSHKQYLEHTPESLWDDKNQQILWKLEIEVRAIQQKVILFAFVWNSTFLFNFKKIFRRTPLLPHYDIHALEKCEVKGVHGPNIIKIFPLIKVCVGRMNHFWIIPPKREEPLRMSFLLVFLIFLITFKMFRESPRIRSIPVPAPPTNIIKTQHETRSLLINFYQKLAHELRSSHIKT